MWREVSVTKEIDILSKPASRVELMCCQGSKKDRYPHFEDIVADQIVCHAFETFLQEEWSSEPGLL